MHNKGGVHSKTTGQKWHEEAVTNSYRDGVVAILVIFALLLCMSLYAVFVSNHAYAGTMAKVTFSEMPTDISRTINDVEQHEMQKQNSAMVTQQLQIMREADAQRAAEAAELAAFEESYFYDDDYYYDGGGVYYGGTYGNANGLNSFDGKYHYGNHLETYYPTPAAYDNQLWIDESGFYRTSDGHYVVASSDYAWGTEIDISVGKAIVMDDGTAPGVVDVHTNWPS